MASIHREPTIKVGLLENARAIKFSLSDTNGQWSRDSRPSSAMPAGDYEAVFVDRQTVRLNRAGGTDGGTTDAPSFAIASSDFAGSRITVHDITIGIDFHWQRQESQQFQGVLHIVPSSTGLTAINELPLESYLVSVISSEMSATCPPELLRAHAIVSRSWLLAQLQRRKPELSSSDPSRNEEAIGERIRWYDRESHADFDVCADDHCQRYQGISKAFSSEAFAAIQETRGVGLTYESEICDARYSKSCGGMTEVFRAAWEERDVPYLVAVYDGEGELTGYDLPLTEEAHAEVWITASPPAYCNADAPEILSRILPGFDQETRDFYRWTVSYEQEELRELIERRTGIRFGRIRALESVERGASARLVKLRVVGEERALIIGKELEIRRALSPSHLYSSAFIVRAEASASSEYPVRFHLLGAGWGHGVGLCQIGAAVMADDGKSHQEILAHYFKDAVLEQLY